MPVLDGFAIVIIRHLRHTWWSALFGLPRVVGEGETADTSCVRLRLGIISPSSPCLLNPPPHRSPGRSHQRHSTRMTD